MFRDLGASARGACSDGRSMIPFLNLLWRHLETAHGAAADRAGIISLRRKRRARDEPRRAWRLDRLVGCRGASGGSLSKPERRKSLAAACDVQGILACELV